MSCRRRSRTISTTLDKKGRQDMAPQKNLAENQEAKQEAPSALERVKDLQGQIGKHKETSAAIRKKVADSEAGIEKVKALAPAPPAWIDKERDELLADIALGVKDRAALQGFIGRANAANKAYAETLARSNWCMEGN